MNLDFPGAFVTSNASTTSFYKPMQSLGVRFSSHDSSSFPTIAFLSAKWLIKVDFPTPVMPMTAITVSDGLNIVSSQFTKASREEILLT